MPDQTKKLNYGEYQYGDVVRLTRAIRKSSGKRYKFIGAVFDDDDDDEPIYLDLIEIGKGSMRSIRPEHVIKDVAASKEAQASIQKAGK